MATKFKRIGNWYIKYKDAMKIIRKRKVAEENSTYIFINAKGNKLDNDNIYGTLNVP